MVPAEQPEFLPAGSLLLFQRDREPDLRQALTYRERVVSMPAGTPVAEAERLALEFWARLRADLRAQPPGQFVTIAVFDHVFQSRPERQPLVVLTWKDWRGDQPSVVYPGGPPPTAAQPAVVAPAPPAVAPEPPAPPPSPSTATPPVVEAPAPPRAAPEPSSPASEPGLLGDTAVDLPVAAALAATAAVEAAAQAAQTPEPSAPTPAVVDPPAPEAPPATVAEAPAPLPPAATVPSQPVAQAAPQSTPPSAPTPSMALPFASLQSAAQTPSTPPAASFPTLGASPSRPSAAPFATMGATPAAPVAARTSIAPAAAPPQPARRGRGDELLSDAFEAMQDIVFLREPDEACGFVATVARDLLHAPHVIVSIYDIDRDELVIRAVEGAPDGVGRRGPMAVGPRGQAGIKHLVVAVPAAPADDALAPDAPEGPALYAPAAHNHRLFGMLELHRDGTGTPFDADEEHAAAYIASQLGKFLAEHSRRVGFDDEASGPRR